LNESLITMNSLKAKLVLLLGLTLLFCSAPVAQASSELEVKVALLYNLAKFTAWPEDRFAASDSPLVVYLFGFQQELHFVLPLEGRTVSGHPISVRYTNNADDLHDAHIVYFSSDQPASAIERLERWQQTPILTVGHSREFVQQGGMVALFRKGTKVTFSINIKSVRRSQLQLSTRVFPLADEIVQ